VTRATVYHIFNERLLELFVSATELPLARLMERLLDDPPPALKAWRKSELVHVREVRVFATLAEARAYVDAQMDRPSPWKVLSDYR
jgi:hypothetical protein